MPLSSAATAYRGTALPATAGFNADLYTATAGGVDYSPLNSDLGDLGARRLAATSGVGTSALDGLTGTAAVDHYGKFTSAHTASAATAYK